MTSASVRPAYPIDIPLHILLRLAPQDNSFSLPIPPPAASSASRACGPAARHPPGVPLSPRSRSSLECPTPGSPRAIARQPAGPERRSEPGTRASHGSHLRQSGYAGDCRQFDRPPGPSILLSVPYPSQILPTPMEIYPSLLLSATVFCPTGLQALDCFLQEHHLMLLDVQQFLPLP